MANSGLDKKAFEAIFKTYFMQLCAFACKYIGDLDSSKEIVHEVFIKVWEKRQEIKEDQLLKSYLYTAVKNKCFNHLRDRKKFVSAENAPSMLTIKDNTDETKLMETAELEGKIAGMISNLPEGCKKIFVLNRYEGLKYQEVADKLNLSVKTVETQMSKALKILKEGLKDYLISSLFWLFFVQLLLRT